MLTIAEVLRPDPIRKLVEDWLPCFRLLEHKPIAGYFPPGYIGRPACFSPRELVAEDVLSFRIEIAPNSRRKQFLLLTLEGRWVVCAWRSDDLYFNYLQESEERRIFADEDLVRKVAGQFRHLRKMAVEERRKELRDLEEFSSL